MLSSPVTKKQQSENYKYMTAIATQCAMNQSSEYKVVHYVGIAVFVSFQTVFLTECAQHLPCCHSFIKT